MEHAADGTGGENGDEDEMGQGRDGGREGSYSQVLITGTQRHAPAGRGQICLVTPPAPGERLWFIPVSPGGAENFES